MVALYIIIGGFLYVLCAWLTFRLGMHFVQIGLATDTWVQLNYRSDRIFVSMMSAFSLLGLISVLIAWAIAGDGEKLSLSFRKP